MSTDALGADEQAALARRLAHVQAQVRDACLQAGRDPAGVTLLAVSKLQPAAAVIAAAACGQLDFGENYAQELRDKHRAPGMPAGLRWHFIGALQRNKVRLVVGTAALIHTVDSPQLVAEIAARAQRLGAGLVQDCLIEVNLAAEEQKGGCLPQELPAVLDAFAGSQGARCLGLMCIPPAPDGAPPEASRPYFQRLRALRDEAAATARPQVELRHLSMGMSHDFAIAVAEGATLLRVGTAIFGARPAKE